MLEHRDLLAPVIEALQDFGRVQVVDAPREERWALKHIQRRRRVDRSAE